MDWRDLALCLDEDSDLFFPIGNTGPAKLQAKEAKKVCRECPVWSDCLEYSLELGVPEGIWGGMDETERRAEQRRRSRARVKTPRRTDYESPEESRRLIEAAMKADPTLTLTGIRNRTGITYETLAAILAGERKGEPTRVLPATVERLRFAFSAVSS